MSSQASERALLEAEVGFGLEVEKFFETDIGKYLLARSEAEVKQAVKELKAVDPEDSRTIRRLQNVINRNEGVEGWLAEIIKGGRDARVQIEEEEVE